MAKQKKKVENKEFYIAGKDIIVDPTAPVVSNEFVDANSDWRGQTVNVDSGIKLEDDHGTGEAIILRTFEFGANPLAFKERQPTVQEIFNSHMKGIMGMLWSDGLTPAQEIEPRVIFSKNKEKYLIMVGARPSVGNVLLDKPRTLSEIHNEGREHTNKVPGGV